MEVLVVKISIIGLNCKVHFISDCKHLHFRDFRLILNPRKGLLHPQFKAFAVDGSGNEQIIHVGKFVTL